MEIDELKLYLKIDNAEEDVLLESLKLAAEEYLQNAGVNKNYDKELYKMAIKLLVSHWHENRNAVVVGSITKALEFSLESIITQLVYTQ